MKLVKLPGPQPGNVESFPADDKPGPGQCRPIIGSLEIPGIVVSLEIPVFRIFLVKNP